MTDTEIFELIKKQICEVNPNVDFRSITLRDSLTYVGIEQVDRISICIDLVESLGLSVNPDELYGSQNIGEMVKIIRSKLK